MQKTSEEMFDNALITGADGMVGSYIDFGIRTNHRSLDITDLNETLRVCTQYKPQLIIHLAAETDVDRCERDSTHAYMVNAVGTYNVAFAARNIGAKLVYVSTSAVFDGKKETPYTESDVPCPQSHYGHSKYLGELAVKELLNDALICRICWVFGGGPSKDQKFVAKMLKQLNNPVVNCITGKQGSPTYGKDLVAGIKCLVGERKSGVYHMSNTGASTRFDVVQELINISGAKTEVNQVDPSFFSATYVDRLGNESMSSSAHYMRSWQEALREYVEDEWSDILHTT